MNVEHLNNIQLKTYYETLIKRYEHDIQEKDIQLQNFKKENEFKNKKHEQMHALIQNIDHDKNNKNIELIDLHKINNTIQHELNDQKKHIIALTNQDRSQKEMIHDLEIKLNKERVLKTEMEDHLAAHGIAADGHSLIADQLDLQVNKLKHHAVVSEHFSQPNNISIFTRHNIIIVILLC